MSYWESWALSHTIRTPGIPGIQCNDLWRASGRSNGVGGCGCGCRGNNDSNGGVFGLKIRPLNILHRDMQILCSSKMVG